jgi:hypothetical protein
LPGDHDEPAWEIQPARDFVYPHLITPKSARMQLPDFPA